LAPVTRATAPSILCAFIVSSFLLVDRSSTEMRDLTPGFERWELQV